VSVKGLQRLRKGVECAEKGLQRNKMRARATRSETGDSSSERTRESEGQHGAGGSVGSSVQPLHGGDDVVSEGGGTCC
jgi:hypothetical protein